MNHLFCEVNGFRYVDTDPTRTDHAVVLLHGLLGTVPQWGHTITGMSEKGYRVVCPEIPIQFLPLRNANMTGVMDFVSDFLSTLDAQDLILVGNSLGGQMALMYVLESPERVKGMILTGSAGIYEVETGTRMFRRKDREWIRERAQVSFYNPKFAHDELVNDLYELANDRARAMRVLKIARHSLTLTLNDELKKIKAPTMLIWGNNDQITPRDVARTFESLLPHAELRAIDKCGHAPQIECPDEFNAFALEFLKQVLGEPEFQSSTTSS